MQLHSVKRDLATSGNMEVSKAKIRASSKLFDMFADQTYANKPVAILRELVANGVDAHVAAGTPDRPVEVFMPSAFDPMFKVKDFGIGMSHDFVMGPFMEYTNGSTKDGTDTMIGGFGIGSKSPFAYTDQFTLRVTHDGVLSVYTMFKDEEGIPAIGLQGQTTTDEHNGVEVSFPVEIDDIDEFTSATQVALQYFQPLPIVHGGKITAPEYAHIGKKKNWAMRSTPDGTLGVVMGGVRYPVTPDNLEWNLRNDSRVSPLLNYGIDLFLPIGTCDVAMSREALSYTPRSNEGIRTALAGMVDEVAATFAHLFDKYKTRWSAQAALNNHLAGLSGSKAGQRVYSFRSPRAIMVKQYAKWNGQPLKSEIDVSVPNRWEFIKKEYVRKYPTGYPEGAQLWMLEFSSWRQTFPTSKFKLLADYTGSIMPGVLTHVFVDDMPIKTTSRIAARVKEYLEGKGFNWRNDGQVAVFRAAKNEDKASIQKLLTFLGDPEVVYLSKLPEPARVVRTANANGATVVRPKVRMFKYNGDTDRHGNNIYNLSPSAVKSKAVTEILEADQPASGIMVVMENFELPTQFKEKMKLELIKWDELVFVNRIDAPKIKSTFKNFDDVFAPLYKKFVAKKTPGLGEKAWLSNWKASNRTWLHEYEIIAATIKREKLTVPDNTPFSDLYKLISQPEVTITTQEQALIALEKVVPVKPASFDEHIKEKVATAHPIVVHLLRNVYSSNFMKRVMVEAVLRCL